MDQMVRNDIACNCILIVRIAFPYAHISFKLVFFEDFNCVFTQIRCLSRVLVVLSHGCEIINPNLIFKVTAALCYFKV